MSEEAACAAPSGGPGASAPTPIATASASTDAARIPARVRGGSTSLAARFLIANAVVVLLAALAIGWLVGVQIETSVINRTASLAALYVESFVEPQLQALTTRPSLTPDELSGLDRLLVDTPLGRRVVSFKVWSPEGQILFSPYAPLIGQTVEVDATLARSFAGEVVADVSNLDQEENVQFEAQRWTRLLETYVPVRASGTATIIAVTEFYTLPDELDAEVGAARARSWLLVALVALVSYAVVAGIVKQGSDTISRQERDLRSQVRALSELLVQNARLSQRVHEAAGSSTTLNEQALRRVSSDLHDGAGQALALALLRLDAARAQAASLGDAGLEADLDTVNAAIADGLEDMRAVAAGIRLPELEARTVGEVVERAVEDHEERTGQAVDLWVGEVPSEAPHAIKIALFRTLQEALSNATRHGRGVDVRVRVDRDGAQLRLQVSDGGPGFDPAAAADDARLGLPGMRERAELLGGSFRIQSQPGQGTTVVASWPL